MGVRELLETLAAAVVENPEAVKVSEADEDGTIVLELSVADDDYGRVIGREGRTAQALRTIVKAAAPDGRRVFVDIID
ncbi:MAG: KH domain-containing protein [Solirubrobacterales bacterium]|nr:KH domain-containing protein [Solirubrobacterales bacterium]